MGEEHGGLNGYTRILTSLYSFSPMIGVIGPNLYNFEGRGIIKQIFYFILQSFVQTFMTIPRALREKLQSQGFTAEITEIPRSIRELLVRCGQYQVYMEEKTKLVQEFEKNFYKGGVVVPLTSRSLTVDEVKKRDLFINQHYHCLGKHVRYCTHPPNPVSENVAPRPVQQKRMPWSAEEREILVEWIHKVHARCRFVLRIYMLFVCCLLVFIFSPPFLFLTPHLFSNARAHNHFRI